MFFRQKNYPYGKQSVSVSDVWEIVRAARSPWLTQGPRVRQFEDALCAYTGAKFAVAVSNGTAALHIAMLALGLQPTDEVITSPMTFLASANCVLYAGGIVRFADIEADTALIDSGEIKRRISPKTKAIIPVHFAGQSCDMEEIHQVAKQHGLAVIEDAAHAIGSEYKDEKVGSCKYSDITIFSFHPVKTITTGEGGAIMTNSRELYDKMVMLRSHGVTRDGARLINKREGAWYYEMQLLGFNYRLTDLQSALGLAQLKKLDRFVKRRREIVESYKRALSSERCCFLVEKDYSRAAFHLCPLLVDFSKTSLNKVEVFEKLREKGLNLQVHYMPVHLQPYYRKLGFKEGDYPNAEAYYRKAISLPLFPELKNRDIGRIVRIIRETVN